MKAPTLYLILSAIYSAPAIYRFSPDYGLFIGLAVSFVATILHVLAGGNRDFDTDHDD